MEEEDSAIGPLVLKQKKRKKNDGPQGAVSPMRKDDEQPAPKQQRSELTNLLMQPPAIGKHASWLVTKHSVEALQAQQQLDIARNEIAQLKKQVAKYRDLSIELETRMEAHKAQSDNDKCDDGSEDGEVDNAALRVDHAKLSLDIDNFTEFGCGMPEDNPMRYSEEVTVRGVPFKIRTFAKISDDAEDPGFFLYLFLDSEPAKSGWEGWSSRIEGKMRVCPKKEGNAPYVQSFSRLFHAKDKSFGFEDFVSIATLENAENGWVLDDKVTVEVEFTANQPHDIESWIALTQALEEERKRCEKQAEALEVSKAKECELERAIQNEINAKERMREMETEIKSKTEELITAEERNAQQNKDWDVIRDQYEQLIIDLETSNAKTNANASATATCQSQSQQSIDPAFLRKVRDRDRQFSELKTHYDQIRSRLTLLFPESTDGNAFPPNAELKLHWLLNIVSYNTDLFHQTFGSPVDGQYLLPKHVIAPHSRRIRRQFDEGHIPPEDFANFSDDIIQRLIFYSYTGSIPDSEIDQELMEAARFFEFGVLGEHCKYIMHARNRGIYAQQNRAHSSASGSVPQNFRIFSDDSVNSSVESTSDDSNQKRQLPENSVLRVNNSALNTNPKPAENQ